VDGRELGENGCAEEFWLEASEALGTNDAMHRPGEYCCVFVTVPNLSVARKIAVSALSEKLVACANLLPKIESHYWWKGQLESSSEVLILFKTAKNKIADLERCVVKHHPYDTPEFVAVALDHGTEKYLSWISNSVEKP
jgi:periplasmic divalent cation tolerance protein